MNSILITGGTGYIGSHTCIELLKKGFNVCLVDSLINSSEKTVTKIQGIVGIEKTKENGELFFRKGDVRDKIFLFNVFDEFKIKGKPFSAVIHFAGFKSVQDSVKEPLKYWNNNLFTTLNLLEIMNSFGCYCLVFSSSATIYESKGNENLSENNSIMPINPYGNTKFTIEKILGDVFKCNKTKWKIANLRYFNPVGAHNSGLLGENPKNRPTNLFPIILKVATGEYSRLSIFGNDWPTKDGTCIRDYIHIMDLAEAHVAALDFLNKNIPQIIALNIGTGKGTSVLEIIDKFVQVNRVSLPFYFEKRREGDIHRLVADNTRSLSLLNWKPKRSIEDMCTDSWKTITSI